MITLEGTNTLSYSGRFILAEATSAWGSGTSGADVVVTSEQSLKGNMIYRDSYSTLKINGTTVITVGPNVTL